MKAKMSKDGLYRLNVTIKTRVSFWTLMIEAIGYTESTDKHLTSITSILREYRKNILEYGLYRHTDMWNDYFVTICDEHWEFYSDLLSPYFSNKDRQHAADNLDRYR